MKNTQSGRTLSEMLGILGIVGVLTLGSVLGATTLIQRHRANEIMRKVQKLATMARTAKAGKGILLYLGADGDCPFKEDVQQRCDTLLGWNPVAGVYALKADATTVEAQRDNLVSVRLLIRDGETIDSKIEGIMQTSAGDSYDSVNKVFVVKTN